MEHTKKKKPRTSYTYKTPFEFSRHIQRSMWKKKKKNIDIPTEVAADKHLKNRRGTSHVQSN